MGIYMNDTLIHVYFPNVKQNKAKDIWFLKTDHLEPIEDFQQVGSEIYKYQIL